MEKLSEALNKLDELAVKMDGIMGVSFLLWESIDGGSDRVKVDIHGSAAYFLHDEITEYMMLYMILEICCPMV